MDKDLFTSSGKITLDQKTFKALASETRIDILKTLDSGQKTVSDISRMLNMNKATILEHIEKLREVGLVKRMEDHRKWVYYRLSFSGKNLLHPERIKIAILLSITMLCVVAVLLYVALVFGPSIYDGILDNEPDDNIPPSIQYTTSADLTERSLGDYQITIRITDNQDIKASTAVVDYVIVPTISTEPDSSLWISISPDIYTFTDWTRLSFNLTGIDWTTHASQYVIVRCSVSDKSGNTAISNFTDFVDPIYDNLPDASISLVDINFGTVRALEGRQNVNIRVNVHNTGNGNLTNLDVAFYTEEPARNQNGSVLPDPAPVYIFQIGYLVEGNTFNVYHSLRVNLSLQPQLWVVLDPYNKTVEANEDNNILEMPIKPGYYAIPEFNPLVALLAVFIGLLFIHKRRRSR
jgi:DNA-binding transcriptional ArsR family regulator